MSKEMIKYDLEERLVGFAVRIIRLVDSLPKTNIGRHIGGQIVRSGTAPAAHYGEAQGAESKADFIHKMRIALKESRETRVWLLIIQKAELIKPSGKLADIIDESNQLISIFVASIGTARKKK
jgi:four helix bundle protein